ncbi:polysaccharide deacetylase [Mesorhizobium sp. CAU 1741]|uniref:polysaccharide deacetylase family protein n=1 Tax=Mesorhizobium sp. CAU 1741 TaxID=3140366 RepID=UPI00325AAA9B
MTTPTPISRGEFGLVGARRLLALLEKHGIRSTWFVPGVVIDTHEEAVAEVVAAGHEIAHHGYSHSVPASLPPEKEEAEMVRAIDSIRRITGKAPRGYRSPAWDLSPVTIDLLLKYGFDYESSLMGHDHLPYYARSGDRPTVDEPFVFGEHTRLVEMPISWTLDDHPHLEHWRTPTTVNPGLMNASGVLENWVDDFRYMTRTEEWGVLTYTCHPYVIGRGHRMIMLEKLIDSLKEMGAAFMALEDAADEFEARPRS